MVVLRNDIHERFWFAARGGGGTGRRRRRRSFPRPGSVCDKYVFPSITLYNPNKTKTTTELDADENNSKCKYALWTSEVGEEEARYYLESLDNRDYTVKTTRFKNVHAARKAIGFYVCCRRVQEKSDFRSHYPDDVWARIVKNGWICNCLWWARSVCCPHVLLARALDQHAKGENVELYDMYTAAKFRSKYAPRRVRVFGEKREVVDDGGDAGFNSPKRVRRTSLGGKQRWRATPPQLSYLNQLFDADQSFPSGQAAEIVKKLSAYGPIEIDNVFHWFTNKQQKERRKRKAVELAQAGRSENTDEDVVLANEEVKAATKEPPATPAIVAKEEEDIFDNHDFTDEQNKKIDAALIRYPSDMLPVLGNSQLTYNDVQSLETDQKVRDECINFFFQHILSQRVRGRLGGEAPRFHFFNTYFADLLIGDEGYTFDKVKSWTTKKKSGGYFPIQCKKLIMPIFHTSAKGVEARKNAKDGHWFLAVVDTEEKKVLIYDSLQHSMRAVTEEMGKNLIKWVGDESEDKLKERWDTSTWKVEYPEEPPVPQQDNGADCGMFTMNFARNILSFMTGTNNNAWTFDAENIPGLRRRFILEICELCEKNGKELRKSTRMQSQTPQH